MTLAEDLQRLADLHARGALSDDEFRRAKARLLSVPADSGFSTMQAAVNGLRRSRSDRWLGGVCGGIAVSTGLAAWVWRLLFVLLLSCAGTGLIVYALAWLLLPLDDAGPGLAPSPAPGLPPA